MTTSPAACDCILNNLKDFGIQPDYYDKIITGDLGTIGQRILKDMLLGYGYDISKQHMDCGTEIYYNEEQDTNAGGSGCGCSAITLTGYILNKCESMNGSGFSLCRREPCSPQSVLTREIAYQASPTG